MYLEYQKVTYSLKGNAMRLVCDGGFIRFKISSGMGTRPRLFWQTGRKWTPINDVMIGDTSVVFEGMGKEGGVPVSELLFGVDLPIFNERTGLNTSDYFYKSRKAGFSQYVYIIDMVNQTLTARNIDPIVDYVKFDKRRYLLEQAYRTPEKAMTVAQAEQIRQQQQEREAFLSEIAANYSQEIRVVTMQLEHEEISDCYLD